MAVRPVSGQIHGQRCVAALGPMPRPFGKRFAAAAMNQDHPRKWAVAIFRTGVISKNAGRLALERFAFVIGFLDEIGGLAPLGERRLAQGLQVPRSGETLGVGRNRKETQQNQERDLKSLFHRSCSAGFLPGNSGPHNFSELKNSDLVVERAVRSDTWAGWVRTEENYWKRDGSFPRLRSPAAGWY